VVLEKKDQVQKLNLKVYRKRGFRRPARSLRTRPSWRSRAIAEAVGVHHETVAATRDIGHLAESATSSKSSRVGRNGRRDLITLGKVNGSKTAELIDGRNGMRACEIAGVEPTRESLNGRDAVALISSNNVARRQMTKRQIAITIAPLQA
jgi:hypothetical protein